MRLKPELRAYVDDEGRLVIPGEVMSLYGLKPRSQVRIEQEADSLALRHPVTHLRKVYIEPTNRCNLECRTCIRNVWDERRIVLAIPSLPVEVVFGRRASFGALEGH